MLPAVLKDLHEAGVEIRGCATTCSLFGDALPVAEADWSEEFLAPIIAVRVVDSMDAAIEHIRAYGSDHTEIIITENYTNSQEWLRRVNSSTVGVNCSTGFSDGFQLGLGAEIGISTSKLHAYGPMGLESLTTEKYGGPELNLTSYTYSPHTIPSFSLQPLSPFDQSPLLY